MGLHPTSHHPLPDPANNATFRVFQVSHSFVSHYPLYLPPLCGPCPQNKVNRRMITQRIALSLPQCVRTSSLDTLHYMPQPNSSPLMCCSRRCE